MRHFSRAVSLLFITAVLGLSLTVWSDVLRPLPANAQQSDSSTITIRSNQTSVYEGGQATFILERYGGSVAPLVVQVKTLEPDKQDGEGNASEELHEVRFGRGDRRLLLHAVPFVDGTAESGAQTLNAQVLASGDSSYQVGSADTASITILDPPADNSVAVVNVTRSSDQSSVAEGVTITYTFTRAGGDTTQPLSVDIEVSDPGDFLRGDFWDAPPALPNQVQFGAGSTSQTLDLTVPDDRRHLYLDGVTVTVLPSADYLLKFYGEDHDTSAVVYVNDNDTAQQLELNFGKDGTNDADVDEGDTLKLVVKRRQRDADNGETASFTVRVETDRSGPDHVMEGWETDSSTSRLYKDFHLEITGSDTEVEREIEVTENGEEEDDWVYEASILAIEDYEGKSLSASEEAQYWSVKSGFRETEVAAADGGDLTGTVTIAASTTTVYEGAGVTYTLTRAGGPIGSNATVRIRTWEPSRRSGGNNPSDQNTDVQFGPWETTATFTISAYVDGVDEAGTDALKARITTPGTGYATGTPHEVDLEIDDPPRSIALITLVRDQASITEGQTAIFTLTRTGGDTTQELTVDLRVDDNGDYLRGNHWDAAPDIPTGATFAANMTTASVSLTAPDDDRDLSAAGLITLNVLPGTGYLLGNTGVETSATISTTDNDTAQVLNLDWGYLDPTDPSWEDGESYAPCTSNGEGGYECTAGPAEGFYYYEDNRNFRFSHEFEEPWPIHFEVSRRAQDVGSTATFVVRVEHNRGWESPRHADWPVDPVTGKRYQEFPLTLTGDQRKVIGRIEILDNGLRDRRWKYTATIKQMEDFNDVPLTAGQENDYWTVQGDRTQTLTKAGEVPFPEFNIKLIDPREVVEGSQYTFTVERKWGNAHEQLPVQIRTWEPNRTSPDGTNPTEQVHNLTFPAVPVTSYFRTTLEQTLDVTVTASDDAIFETSDVLKIELLTPTKRRGSSIVKGQVSIIDDDQPTIELTSDKTSVTEGETVVFTLTRGNNTNGELIVGVDVDDPGNFLLGDYVGDADGVETPTSVMFADGESTKTVAITPPDDRRDISDSALTFTVEESPAYEILGTNPLTVAVVDNDVAPQVQISFNHDEVEEGQDLVLIVKRIGEDKNDLEIPMTGGRDDDQRFTVIGLDPGQSEAHLRYNLQDDEYKGPDVGYSFTLQPENLEFWTPTGDTTVSAKIVDNDPYRVSVRAFSASVDEGQQIYYRIVHDGYTDEALQVNVIHSEIGNAVGDMILGGNTHTIPVGGSGLTRAYPTQANDGSDGDATFTVELVASDDYEINPDRASASVTVVDKDPLPVLRFQNFLVEVREDVGTAEHTVELVSNLPVLRDVSIEYQIQEQFISDGADITERTGTLTIPAGETTGVIEIPIIQDKVAESDETFFVYLRNPVHTTLQYGVSSLRGWGVILDDEPTVTLEADHTAINEGTDAVFTLIRDEGTTEELTVWVQVVQGAPVSENVRETVVFAAGEDTATITIPTENYRARRGVSMTISATLLDPPDVGELRTYGQGTTGPVLITVRDVSLPDVTVSAEDPWIREGETATFTFHRQNGEWRRFTIDIEVVADARFVSSTLPTTITFPLNESSVTLDIETDSDTSAEDNGEITVTVKDGTGYQPRFPSAVTTTVFDDDSGFPDIRVTKSADWVNEGDDVSFTFTRSGATTDSLDFKVSLWRMRQRLTQADLNDPTRHVTTPSSIMPFDQEDLSLTFAAGESSLTITRSTTDDVLNNGNSTYHARVESGADSVYTTVADYTELVWVQDDDRPTITMAPATQEYVGSIPISGLVSLIRPEVTLTRTGDASRNLTTDTHHVRTEHIPPPGPDEVEAGDQFGSFTEGNSSQAAFVSSHLYVNFMGWSGTYSFASPHYCPDVPEECKYRPQYVLGTDTETAYRVYGALMGVRIEADQASFDEGTAATFTLHRLGGKKDAMDRPLQVRVAVTQEGDYITGTTPVTVDFVAGQSTATLTVPTTNDTVDEANGTVRAEILYPTSYADDEFAYEIRKYPGTPWFTDYFATTEIDDDDYIVPNVSVADAVGKEQDGTIEFTVSLDRINDEVQATVNWATAEDGTDTAATSGTDFTADSGTVTFDFGETEKTVAITLLDDEMDEAHETFNLVLSSPSGAILGDETASGTILDDELDIAVVFDSASGNVVEGEDLSFRVKRLPPLETGQTLGGIDPCDNVRLLETCFNSNPTAEDLPDALTIKVSVTQEGDVISGTAPTTVTFQPGSVFATLVVPTVDDSTVEANGVVTAKVLNGSGYSPFSVGLAQDPDDFLPTAARTVYDNDLTISIADASAAEGSGSTLDFEVSLNAPAPQRVTVYAATVDGTATSHDNVTAFSLGQDFTAKSETITFTRGDQTKTFSVAIVDDTIFEMAETLGVRLSSPPHHSTIVDDTGLGTITDDEAPMEASVTRAHSVVNEGHVGPARFVVTLSHPDTTNHERNPAVAWQTVDGAAAGGEDYVTSNDIVNFETGETTGFIDVDIIDDKLVEATLESFSVELLTAGSRLVTLSTTDTSYEASIRDNETLTASIIANAKNVVEGQDAVFTVQLKGGVTTEVTKITFEVSESDSSKTYVDTDDYGTPIGNLIFPENDDSGSSGTLKIPAGESSGTITYPITLDSEDESDPVEHMEVRLFSVYDGLRSSGVSQSQYKARTTILDKGTLTASIEGTPTVTEGGTATFTVSLSTASADVVQVSWATKEVGDNLGFEETAEPDSDYTADSGTVSIAAGSTSGTFTVQTTDDTLVEGSENFAVTLDEAFIETDSLPEFVLLGTTSAVGTITDNDTAPDGVTVTVSPTRIDESNGAKDITVTVSLRGTAQFTTDTPVTLEFEDDTATAGDDYSAENVSTIIPATESSVTATINFTPVDDNVAEGNEVVRLVASSSALTDSDFKEITIEDDDVSPAAVTLSITPVEADESDRSVPIDVTAEFDGTTTLPVDAEVEVTTGGDTATAGVDFESATTTVTIPAGERRATATLSLTILDDSLDEVDEALTVTGRVTNLTGQTVSPSTFTILDNDTAPTGIGLSVMGNAITEGVGAVTLTVRATLQGGGTRLEATTVALSLVDLTAAVADDYTAAWANASLTIPAGQFYGETTLTITAVQDTLYEGAEAIAVRGANTAPGLPVNGVRIDIHDDDPAPTVVALSVDPGTLSESVGTTFADVTATIEGNSTLTEDTQVRVELDLAGSAVRSTLFSSLVIPAGERSARSRLLLTNLNDDVDDDDETLELTGTTDNPDLTVEPAELVITDDDTAGVTISPNSLVVMEGGQSRDYAIKLDSQPTSDVTVTVDLPSNAGFTVSPGSVTFTPQNWRPKSVSVTATDDENVTDEPAAVISHTVTSGDSLYRNAAAGSVSVTVRDDDQNIGVNISETSLTIEEGASDTYNVALGSQPAGDVTITIAGVTDTDVSLDKTTLTFTDQDWNAAQTVTVTAEHDGDAEDEDDVTLTHTVTSADDSDYDGISADSVTVSVTDDDGAPPGVMVSEAYLDLEEGVSATYTVVLDSQPTGDVTVTIAGHASTDVSLDKTTLTFTAQNWDTAQTVTITAEHDDDNEDEDDVTLTHTVTSADDTDYDGIDVDSVTVSVTDDDARVDIYPTTVTVPEGHSAHYTVVLNTQPAGDVTVTINDPTDNTDVTADTATLTFTTDDWHTPQLVTVNAASDTDDDEDSATITHTVSGYGSVTTADDVAVTVTEGSRVNVEIKHETQRHTVREGRSKDIKVVLDVDSERTLVIALTGDPVRGASDDDYTIPAFVVFSPGETEQSYIFTAVDDTVDDDDERVNVSFSNLPGGVSIGIPRRAFVDIGDNDKPETVEASFNYATLDRREGTSITLGVALDQPAERSISVPLAWEFFGGASIADTGGLQHSVTFGAAHESTGWSFSVAQDRIDERGEGVKLTFGELPEGVIPGTPSELIINFVDDDDAGVTISPTTLTVAEGEDGEYTVVLDSQPTRNVTVTIGGASGTDLTLNPSTLTFTTSTWNNARTVTVSAGADEDADSETITLTHTVTSNDALYEGISAEDVVVTVTDPDPGVKISKTALTIVEGSSDTYAVVLNTQPASDVTVTIAGHASTDASLDKTTLTFTDQDWDTAQTVTVTAESDSDTDDEDDITLTHTVASSDEDYDGFSTADVTVSITDDDGTSVSVAFGAAAYSVDESDDSNTPGTDYEAVVTVTLSADPERTVTIPIVNANQGGASDSDYTGVPGSVVFNSGETSKTFTFAATADSEDDDNESVKLTFGETLPAGVTEGTIKETVVSINDDDDPSVSVAFGSATYSVAETDDSTTTGTKENEVIVTVTLSADPERSVIIPIVKTNQGGASSSDYSGVPNDVTFNSGDTSKTFTFSATADNIDDDNESVKLTFGTTLPDGVTEGTNKETVVSITDDDVPSVDVEFGSATYSVDETDDASTTEDKENEAVVTVTLSADPERTVTIGITTTDQGEVNQSQASSADYSGVPANVVFNAGETSKTFTFAAKADTVDDDGESVKLSFNSLPTGVTEGTIKETVVSINDDDLPADVDVEFEQATYTTAEGGTVTVKVTLSEDPERSVTIPIVKTNQGGASDSDYSGVPNDITFNAGDTEKTFTFSAASDSDDDDGESVKLTFGTLPTGITEGTIKETVVSITDDDVPSVDVEFGSATYSVEESDDSTTDEVTENEVVVTVTLSADPERTVTIPIVKANQGGASDSDYTGVPASVVFDSGETSKTFTFAATADSDDDDGESVKLTFGETLPAGVTEGTIKETVVSINDDDDPSVSVAFGSATYSVAETDDSTTTGTKENEVIVTVTLSADPERSVTIPIVKANQGGASSSDYSGVPDNITFNSGDTSKTFTFAATADTVDDDGESVKLTFTNLPTGVTEGTIKETVVSITDDDVPSVTVSFENSAYSVDEGSSATIKVILSAKPERAVAIPVSATYLHGVGNGDFSGAPVTLNFAGDDTEKTITFAASEDSHDDDGEQVKLTFGTLPDGVSEGSPKETVVSINDDDLPADVDVEFGQSSYTVDEGSNVTVTVTLSEDPERTVTIPVSKANEGGASSSDYSGVPASVAFNAGETSKTFSFAATSDTVDDDDESVKLTFGTLPTGVTEGTTTETVVSITDDDVPSVTVAFGAAAYSVDETDDASTTEDKENEAVVTVTLSADPERTVTIGITTTDQGEVNQSQASSADYSGVPANVVFNAGETSKTFTFAAKADTVDDDGESVKLTFNSLPTGVTEGTIKETVVSINDDDLPADVDVEFGQGSYTVDEGSSVTVTVTLSEDPERTVTIPISKANEGGASSSDYSGVPASVAFNAGETSKTFSFAATSDTVDDDDESVKLTFGTLPTGVTEGTTTETVVSITDDDVPSVTVAFGAAAYSVDETDDASTTEDKENEAVVTVTLSADPERTVTIGITTTDQGEVNQSQASSADYSGVPANVVFNAGETSKTFTFAAKADTVDDDGESVKLTFNSLPTGVTEGTIKETVVSINDDDLPADVDVEFGQATYTAAEGSTVTVKVTLSEDPERSVTIPIVKTNQGGASSSDYSGVPNNITFNAGDTEKTFTFSAASDSVDDDGESVMLTFGTTLPDGVTEGTTKETVVSITDDDVPGVSVAFGAATYSVDETDDTSTTEDKENEAVVTVTLSADPERTLTIGITTTDQGEVNQSQASSADYSGVPANVVFNAGETSKTFTFVAKADTVDDDGESVKLTFNSLPTGVTEGTIKETVVSINDDDLPADVDVEFGQGSYTLAEGSNVTVTVTLSEDPERTVTIPVSKANQGGASNSDYSGVPASVVFNAGETSKTFSFAATSDTVDDDGESVNLSFGTLPTGVTEGTTNETTVSITDDDVPSVTVSFGSATYSVDETDDTTTTEDKENEAVVTVTLSADPERTVTIPISKANQGGASDSDYSGVPASVVFNSGETSKTFTFAATADTVDDDDESVKLTFGATLPTGVTEGTINETIISITDDDVPSVTVSFGAATYTVAETDDTSTTEDKENEAVVTVTLSADPERTVTIPIAKANQGGASSADYSGVPATIAFASGETSKTFTFAATADTIDDDGESVKLTFGTTLPTGVTEGTTKEAVVSINDDDAPSGLTVNFEQASYTVTEGSDVTVKVTLSEDPERTVTIPLKKNNQGGASDSDYSGVPTSVTFNSGETEKSFIFSATADNIEDSGESVKLTFGTTLPTGVIEGTTKETVVSISNVSAQNSLTVNFGSASYGLSEGGTTTIEVTLNTAPGSDVVIPLTTIEQGGATSADYSGVPTSVTFGSSDTEKTFTFSATQDTVDDDGESVGIGFGTLPAGVTAGTTSETVVSITDDDLPADRLMSLVVTPKDIDGFDPDITDYMVGMAPGVSQATITATPYRSDDTVTINGTDVTNGSAHTVSLSVGLNTFEVVVTSVGSADPTTYKVYIGRGTTVYGGWKAGDDLDTLRAAGNTSPSGIWSDGTTIWISDVSTATLYAYSQAAGTRDSGKDIALGSAVMGPTGIWSDETTIWVIGPVEDMVFAYTLSSGARDSSSDFEIDSSFMLPVDLWSDGVTMWIVDSHGDKLYAYTLSGGARDTNRDIDLAIENAAPAGVWSDGTTIWVTDSNDDKLYAYTLSGERVAGFDIDLHSRNSDAFNLWGNTDTLWVANNINDVNSPFNRIFTYNNVPVTVTFGSATYSVAESDDASTTDVEENKVEITVTLNAAPQRQVVLPITVTNQGTTTTNDYSGVPGTLTFESGDSEKTFSFTATEDTVEDGGESVKLTFGTLPPGVIGGTNTEAVVSIVDDDTGVSFERMAYEATEGETVDIKLTLSSAVTKEITVPLDKTGLGGASNLDYSGIPESVIFESGETEKEISFTAVEDEVDDDGESVKLRFGTLPTGVVPGVNDETVVSITDDDQPTDRLMSLVVSPKDIDGFDSEVADYMVGVDATVAQATITATPYRTDDTVTINGTEVTNGSAHAVSLSAGLNTFAIVVNSSATADTTTYTVYIGRGTTDQGGWKAADDLDTLRNAGNTSPAGIWSNGTTMWIADSVDAKLYAYTLADGSRDSVKDITLHSDNSSPAGIWSDETNIWVVDQLHLTVFAYTISNGLRDTSKEFTRSSGNATAWGIWSDGTTMWVVDWNDDKLYAYALADGSRDSDKDFNLTSGNASPRGIWSNGTTMWIVDVADDKLYAYDLSGSRVEGYDIDLHSSNSDATGIWGNDDTVWAVNSTSDDGSPFDRVYTYNNIPVTVSFEQGTYTLAEGNSVTIEVVLSADPERTVTIPITKANQDGASSSDYSGVPANVVFNSGDTEKTFTFTATSDSVDDDGESVKLTFGTTLPAGVTEGTTNETVVSITDDDAPTDPQVSVTVSFESSAYSLVEGSTVAVTVSLSEDPERTVTIPVTTNNGTGASDDDYSGVPDNVVFNSGDTEKSFSFFATQDSYDEDEETVTLGFGDMPSGVRTATPAQAAISIRDSLRVSFGASIYEAHEGGDDAIVVVRSNEAASVATVIPIELTLINGVSNDDFDGVPSEVVFGVGERSKSFTVTAVDDDVEDGGEMILLGFGDLPAGVVAGSPSTATVELMNMENGAVHTQCPDDSGRRIILDSRGEITETNVSQFWKIQLDPYRTYLIEIFGSRFQADLIGDELPNETRTLPNPMVISFHNGDRSEQITSTPLGNAVDLVRGTDATGWHQIEVSGMGETGTYRIRVRVNNVCVVSDNRARYRYFGGPDGYVLDIPAGVQTTRGLDTRHVSTETFLGDNWSWYWDSEPDVDWFEAPGLKMDQEYNIVAWAADGFSSRDQATDLKIVGVYDSDGNLISDTTSASTGKHVSINFEPVSDGTYYVAIGSGSGDRTGVYEVKIENAAGFGNNSRGDNNSDQNGDLSDRRESDNRDFDGGNSEEDKSDGQTVNTPATGAPAVTGTTQVGETLTADTSGIADNDGLDRVDFTYQWLAGGTAIEVAEAATYLLTTDEIGKRITVQVGFTDDEGNAEAVVSEVTSAVIPENPA